MTVQTCWYSEGYSHQLRTPTPVSSPIVESDASCADAECDDSADPGERRSDEQRLRPARPAVHQSLRDDEVGDGRADGPDDDSQEDQRDGHEDTDDGDHENDRHEDEVEETNETIDERADRRVFECAHHPLDVRQGDSDHDGTDDEGGDERADGTADDI